MYKYKSEELVRTRVLKQFQIKLVVNLELYLGYIYYIANSSLYEKIGDSMFYSLTVLFPVDIVKSSIKLIENIFIKEKD